MHIPTLTGLVKSFWESTFVVYSPLKNNIQDQHTCLYMKHLYHSLINKCQIEPNGQATAIGHKTQNEDKQNKNTSQKIKK